MEAPTNVIPLHPGAQITPLRPESQGAQILSGAPRPSRTAKEIRKECDRRSDYGALVLPQDEVPYALRAHIERTFDVLASGEHYLFPHVGALNACKALCSPVIRRSTVPLELHAQMALWGGMWCPEMIIPIDSAGRAERGGWWFSHPADLARARSFIATGRPNDGRGAWTMAEGLFYLFAEYMPELVYPSEIRGRRRKFQGRRPAWVFKTQAQLELALGHCRAVLPYSQFPRMPPNLFSPWHRVRRAGGVPNDRMVCLTEEIGGIWFPKPADLVAAREMLQAEAARIGTEAH